MNPYKYRSFSRHPSCANFIGAVRKKLQWIEAVDASDLNVSRAVIAPCLMLAKYLWPYILIARMAPVFSSLGDNGTLFLLAMHDQPLVSEFGLSSYNGS